MRAFGLADGFPLSLLGCLPPAVRIWCLFTHIPGAQRVVLVRTQHVLWILAHFRYVHTLSPSPAECYKYRGVPFARPSIFFLVVVDFINIVFLYLDHLFTSIMCSRVVVACSPWLSLWITCGFYFIFIPSDFSRIYNDDTSAFYQLQVENCRPPAVAHDDLQGAEHLHR